MNWEEIKDEKLSIQVRDFYLFQAMLIMSPLNKQEFPQLTSEYENKFDLIYRDMVDMGFSIIKKEEPKDQLLASLARLSTLQLYLQKDGEIFQPPQKLSYMQIHLINSIPTPWK